MCLVRSYYTMGYCTIKECAFEVRERVDRSSSLRNGMSLERTIDSPEEEHFETSQNGVQK